MLTDSLGASHLRAEKLVYYTYIPSIPYLSRGQEEKNDKVLTMLA